MRATRSPILLTVLVRELCKLPTETGGSSSTENNDRPEQIGESLLALSYSAALEGNAFSKRTMPSALAK
jgi:hypothetical protein